jgi:5-(carboxyamino)imidazole ribonucleotide mutase
MVMADILVLFASKGDEKAFKPALEALDKYRIKYDFRMASAHKTPDDVDAILRKKYKLIITGAGLAAALPGVVAAKTISPVIGVPCSGSLEGLDAFLSILQMPPGVPVLCTGVDRGDIAAEMAVRMLSLPKQVFLVGDKNTNAYKKAESLLEDFGVMTHHAQQPQEGGINVVFAQLDGVKVKGVSIHCPVVEEKDEKAENALRLRSMARDGLWVGVNNGTNAAIAAVEILNMDGSYEEKLLRYRKEQADKVRAYSK